MKTIIFILIVLMSKDLFAINTMRDEPAVFPTVDTTGTVQPIQDHHRWSIETSLTFPIVRIYMVKAGYYITERSELGFGIAFQNWRNDDDVPMGQSNAWTIPLSYRYYFWRNFNVELELWPAYNQFESFVDGRTYKGFELWIEYRAGYRFDPTSSFSLNLQPGIGHPLWLQHRWPGLEDKSNHEFISDMVIFVPQVLIGWKF